MMAKPSSNEDDMDSFSGEAMQKRRAGAIRTAIIMAMFALGMFALFFFVKAT